MESVWHAICQGVRADFSDLPGVVAVKQLVLRMLLATLLGGLLGYQRERCADLSPPSGPIDS